jgi:hypothetical protein
MNAILAKLGYETKVTTPAEFADFLTRLRLRPTRRVDGVGLRRSLGWCSAASRCG